MKVPFLEPHITARDIKELVTSVKSGWLIHGPYSHKFEEELAKYLNVPYVIMTSSATAALHMALMVLGVKEGDEVITTPISWVATANAILYQRAKPVFADIDPATGLLDPKDVERKITKKTKAILPVHLYGQMADMKAFERISKKYKIPIIEDAAHSLEASRDGLRSGHVGLAAFSFHAAKNITSGQGGALVVHTDEQAKLARLVRRDGVANMPDGKRRMTLLGYKYDGTDFQAALLRQQLKHIKPQHAKRMAVWERYHKGLSTLPGVTLPKLEKGAIHSGHKFTIFVDPAKREAIRAYLVTHGIESPVHYEAIHLEPYYQQLGYRKGIAPHAERMGASLITLPTYARLTALQQNYIIKSIKNALAQI